MEPKQIQAALTQVITYIQTASDLDCPALVGDLKPVEDLPKFDSKIWPVAIGLLSDSLGITIANDVNIFRQEKSCIALTIDEIVLRVSKLIDEQMLIEPKQAISK